MQTRLLSLAVCASLLLTLVVLTPSRALADSIDSISVTASGQAIVVEGNGGSLTYTVTNTGMNNVILNSLAFGPVVFKEGDDKDQPDPALKGGTCTAGLMLVPTASCTLIFNFTTVKQIGENDNDSGLSSVTATVGTMNGPDVSGTGRVKVKDFAPEPSTYLLFGTGLASMGGMLRRKLRM